MISHTLPQYSYHFCKSEVNLGKCEPAGEHTSLSSAKRDSIAFLYLTNGSPNIPIVCYNYNYKIKYLE